MATEKLLNDSVAAGIQRDILNVTRRFWGYDRLRPLQEEAIMAGVNGRDSLVVMPTGGGKSLCYQVPPLITSRTHVVVSPLISLMKDQVDALTVNGYPAATLHSALTSSEIREATQKIESGTCRLIFMSPERVLTPWFKGLAERLNLRNFAVDEAHCISHWGHDFRPEYRRMGQLKLLFSDVSLHAFTATATERVRTDIIRQLGLLDPEVLVGQFDRPNLIYRIVPRLNRKEQILEVVRRHPSESVIIYCITRDETERISGFLKEKRYSVAHYHAGLSADERRAAQEAFTNEQIDIIVATVAFGMGIDRSNVRCVIHAGMPQSVEHYQQETGRAGRDGLEAECVLLYSPADVMRWQSIIEKNGRDDPGRVSASQRNALEMLGHMRQFASPAQCRHKSLSEYFGQDYPRDACGACDICLNEVAALEDGTVRAQMILSCVARTQSRFGAGYIADIVCGADTDRIRSRKHNTLSTYGLLKDTSKKVVSNLIFQLLDQGLLSRSGGEYPVLQLNDRSWEVLRGQRTVRVLPVRQQRVKRTAAEAASWEGVDRDLFEQLRALRTELARERGVPPYIIFNDASLRDMARRRPASEAAFLHVSGVGEKKLADFGDRFLSTIISFSSQDI